MTSVSVVIPTFNRAQLISEAINSVLNQSYEHVEIVVVDDGSTDNTADIVHCFGNRVHYIYQENSGVCIARNIGVLNSNGDYLIFLDSDDILIPGMITKLASALDDNQDFGAAYCGFQEIDGFGNVKYQSPLDRPSGNVFVEMVTQSLCIVHSVMMRRKCLARAGLFDPSLKMYEDMEFNIRLAAYFPFVFIPEYLVQYRLAYSELSKHKSDAGIKIYLNKLMHWKKDGRLNTKHWQTLKKLLYGPRGGEKQMCLAYDAYDSGNWREAFPFALLAIIMDPRYIISKNWWALTVKSIYRSLYGAHI